MQLQPVTQLANQTPLPTTTNQTNHNQAQRNAHSNNHKYKINNSSPPPTSAKHTESRISNPVTKNSWKTRLHKCSWQSLKNHSSIHQLKVTYNKAPHKNQTNKVTCIHRKWHSQQYTLVLLIPYLILTITHISASPLITTPKLMFQLHDTELPYQSVKYSTSVNLKTMHPQNLHTITINPQPYNESEIANKLTLNIPNVITFTLLYLTKLTKNTKPMHNITNTPQATPYKEINRKQSKTMPIALQNSANHLDTKAQSHPKPQIKHALLRNGSAITATTAQKNSTTNMHCPQQSKHKLTGNQTINAVIINTAQSTSQYPETQLTQHFKTLIIIPHAP
eukprot:gene2806-1791_t